MTTEYENCRNHENWPRLTPVQRNTMLDFEKSRHGDLHFSDRALRTAWALKERGFIEGGTGNWYSITRRGREYLRFGLRRKP